MTEHYYDAERAENVRFAESYTYHNNTTTIAARVYARYFYFPSGRDVNTKLTLRDSVDFCLIRFIFNFYFFPIGMIYTTYESCSMGIKKTNAVDVARPFLFIVIIFTYGDDDNNIILLYYVVRLTRLIKSSETPVDAKRFITAYKYFIITMTRVNNVYIPVPCTSHASSIGSMSSCFLLVSVTRVDPAEFNFGRFSTTESTPLPTYTSLPHTSGNCHLLRKYNVIMTNEQNYRNIKPS
uniref:Uncharacterized protein n=1 Tax=Sipha flava TaxID=143950 RepID=A0A2S2QGG6_9HEMI